MTTACSCEIAGCPPQAGHVTVCYACGFIVGRVAIGQVGAGRHNQTASGSVDVVQRFASREGRSVSASIFWAAFAAALLGCAAIGVGTPAEAQQQRLGQAGRQQQAQATPRVLPRHQSSPLVAVVSLGSQRVTIYDRSGPIATSPISSGRRGHESPQGIFSIIEKKEEHFSNLYDDAEMPWMQRLTWSGVAFHAGALPGYPASKGCIRLPHHFAEQWFSMTRINTRVVIAANDTVPAAITHARLPQPHMAAREGEGVKPQANEPAATGEPSTPRAAPAFRREDGSSETPMMLGGRLPRPEPAPATEAATPQRAVVTPMEAAQARKTASAQAAAAAVKAADQGRVAVRTRLAEAQKADRAAKQAEAQQKQAEGRSAQLARAIAAARTDDSRKALEAQKAKLDEDVTRLAKAAADARALAVQRTAEHKEAADAIKALDQARTAAQAEAKDAARLTEPISVFVSRETGRVYVRQNREPVMEMPVRIERPDEPIGTHVFTAMDANDGGARVKWQVVSVTSASPAAVVPPPTPGEKGRGRSQPRAPLIDARTEGTAALERITLPKEVLDRVAPYVHVGSSFIVSDLGPSFETGQATDFIVQTKGEEEARESVRRIIEEKKVEKAMERRERDGWPEERGSRRQRAGDDGIRWTEAGSSRRNSGRDRGQQWGGGSWGGNSGNWRPSRGSGNWPWGD